MEILHGFTISRRKQQIKPVKRDNRAVSHASIARLRICGRALPSNVHGFDSRIAKCLIVIHRIIWKGEIGEHWNRGLVENRPHSEQEERIHPHYRTVHTGPNHGSNPGTPPGYDHPVHDMWWVRLVPSPPGMAGLSWWCPPQHLDRMSGRRRCESGVLSEQPRRDLWGK